MVQKTTSSTAAPCTNNLAVKAIYGLKAPVATDACRGSDLCLKFNPKHVQELINETDASRSDSRLDCAIRPVNPRQILEFTVQSVAKEPATIRISESLELSNFAEPMLPWLKIVYLSL